ncbi:hypothetical protein TD95_004572 [Thielaviopsis punctulata]|uniref:Nicotinamide N-methyltransferase n=1 Tax=Thielaviopsis punctulata TaxID=72032 RepID=A0A0F4Z851_9PEZI|nr:hypothetical protein TD95_004572 [Thielaviopsis punctulata]
MALTSRVTLVGPDNEVEDIFSSSLGVIFTDDITNQHGDNDHGILYTSPFLPRPFTITLNEPQGNDNRRLFSHYLWNASLLLAEYVERDCLSAAATAYAADRADREARAATPMRRLGMPDGHFDVRALRTLEMGAGTALPSIMSALLGARQVVVTDYPAPEVIATLRDNVMRNTAAAYAPDAARRTPTDNVVVAGHEWGVFPADDAPAVLEKHAFDRVFVADCLWMPWQHANLRASINHFMARDAAARAWIVAGFHTGREKMRGFFDAGELAKEDLEVENIWERDCDGVERPWVLDRGVEDITERKRWLVVCVLKRPSV